MTRARRELVDIETTPYYHCICRCVRRAFLCGKDSFSGRNYDHRKVWILERISHLQSVFAVDLCAYAIMSNHYHLVVRLNNQQGTSWSEEEVMARWGRLFSLPPLIAKYRAGRTIYEAERDAARSMIATWRERLCDLSWYMRSLNEDLARRANAEDGCKGRFWGGRFKSQALLDTGAVLTCMSYVDLNPIRAGVAETPETSNFTSIQQRIDEYAERSGGLDSDKPDLIPLNNANQESHPNAISFTADDYFCLLDWSGRAIRDDKCGAISSSLPPILTRLQIAPEHYLSHVKRGGRGYHVVALGQVERLRDAAKRFRRRFLKGHGLARKLFPCAG